MTKQQKQQSIEEKMNAIYTNKMGRRCKIKEYRTFHDVDVEFLDDGVIKTNLDCKNLQNGQFSHPDDLPNATNRIGTTIVNKSGIIATVTQYNGSQDFIIQFQDETTKHLSSWSEFLKGNFTYNRIDKFKLSDGEIEKRKQIIRTNKNGYNMRLLNYRSSTDVDIIFEDGTVAYNKMYYDFDRCKIPHPKYKTLKADKLAKIKQNGIKDVIRYENMSDFDIELIDGTILHKVSYQRCTSGDIARLSRTKLIR